MERPGLTKQKTDELTLEEIRSWPKTDLHCHLDGSLRLETLTELAREQRIPLPSDGGQELRSTLGIGRRCSDLDEYVRNFDFPVSVLQDKDTLERVAFELAEDAARENVVYLEVRYSPVLHTARALTWSETVDSVLAGLKAAEKKYCITCRVILTGIRSIDPIISKELAELAVAYKGRGVVGFDLAGIEENNPAKSHQEAFYVIKNNNINCTLHAGETIGRTSIHQALHHCGADRIGQGTKLSESADLLNYVNNHRIPLEICLTSSLLAGTVSSLTRHPFPLYLNFGLRVTLNSDSRLIADTTVSDELFLAHKTYNLTRDDLVDVVINGFKSAFLPFKKKVKMLVDHLPALGRKAPKYQAMKI